MNCLGIDGRVIKTGRFPSGMKQYRKGSNAKENTMTIEEIAKLGEWIRTGNIKPCGVRQCGEESRNYAHIMNRQEEKTETWYFCDKHFREYLRECDRLREGRLPFTVA